MTRTTALPWGGHVKAVQAVRGLRDVRSSTLEEIATRMVLTSRKNSIMAIYGPSGVGKSFATGRAAEMCAADPERPAEIAWVEFTAGTQGRPLLVDLFPQITGTAPPARATARQLESHMAKALTDRHRVVVLDEAHMVRPAAMKVLRGLHDHPDTDFALVLVGLDDLIRSLPPEMETRVQTRVKVERIADDEIVAVLSAYHELFDTADPALLVMLNRTRARGEFRWWAYFLANLDTVMPAMKATEITADVADIAADGMR